MSLQGRLGTRGRSTIRRHWRRSREEQWAWSQACGEREEKVVELGLTTLEERRHQADMLQVYKILTGKDNVKSECWFRMAAAGTIRTRQAAGVMNILKPRSRLEVRGNFFSVRVADSWNSVPETIKMSRTTGQFKRQYKKYRSSRPRRD